MQNYPKPVPKTIFDENQDLNKLFLFIARFMFVYLILPNVNIINPNIAQLNVDVLIIIYLIIC